ncbi:hypothetical protein ACFY5C_41620 [Streptomyces sp. NPDC012935]|uniref:hypothetical protein n=1 Tax=Streptomyces sp. NPDC012935 TaxID=3364857 RepID=UPI0036CB1147
MVGHAAHPNGATSSSRSNLQSSEEAALIYQHSDEERQGEVAASLDATVRKARAAAFRKADEKRSGTDLARGE